MSSLSWPSPVLRMVARARAPTPCDAQWTLQVSKCEPRSSRAREQLVPGDRDRIHFGGESLRMRLLAVGAILDFPGIAVDQLRYVERLLGRHHPAGGVVGDKDAGSLVRMGGQVLGHAARPQELRDEKVAVDGLGGDAIVVDVTVTAIALVARVDFDRRH